jgi:hypothetical protein
LALALAALLAAAQRPAAAAQRTALAGRPAPGLPPTPKEGHCQLQPRNPKGVWDSGYPHYLYARAGHHIKKFVYIAFIFRGVPA